MTFVCQAARLLCDGKVRSTTDCLIGVADFSLQADFGRFPLRSATARRLLSADYGLDRRVRRSVSTRAQFVTKPYRTLAKCLVFFPYKGASCVLGPEVFMLPGFGLYVHNTDLDRKLTGRRSDLVCFRQLFLFRRH
jgi:hypothetical protein